MDFARKQLEKYGWTDGKGLGKHENGISEALKPKLKRSVAGIGHDLASDFTEHWWSALYDKAAANVQVKEKNGKTKRIKTKDNDFKITNNSWRIKKKKESDGEDEYAEYFVKTAILSNGGSKTEKVKESESEDEEMKKDVFKMTDEELFAACEGRTAHKGARHGLKALGKLARIERQEQVLLSQPQYHGYSHAKKNKGNLTVNDLQIVEEMNLNSDSDSVDIKKKKKKKRRLNKEVFIQKTFNTNVDLDECVVAEENQIKKEMEIEGDATLPVQKSKKSKRKMQDEIMVVKNEINKKKRHIDIVSSEGITELDTANVNCTVNQKSKKKKLKDYS